MSSDEVVNHLAFSFVHGGFDPDSREGGCSCELCDALRLKIAEVRSQEAADCQRRVMYGDE